VLFVIQSLDPLFKHRVGFKRPVLRVTTTNGTSLDTKSMVVLVLIVAEDGV